MSRIISMNLRPMLKFMGISLAIVGMYICTATLVATAMFNKSPFHMATKVFNYLPPRIKNAPSRGIFKNGEKLFLLERCYYSVSEFLEEAADHRVTSWNLEKYAHHNNDNWMQVDRKKGVIKLILQGSLLLVVQDDIALESVALIHTNCRGLARGSTILFLVSSQAKPVPSSQGDDPSTLDQKKVRKFRIKFCPANGKSAEEQKISCITALQGFMVIYDTDGGVQGGANNPSHITPLKEIACNLLNKSELDKLPGWNAINISKEEELSLERAIKLCLLDPSFPTLVQKIEEKLNNGSS